MCKETVELLRKEFDEVVELEIRDGIPVYLVQGGTSMDAMRMYGGAGFFPAGIFITRELKDVLTAEEFIAVLNHEVGHGKADFKGYMEGGLDAVAISMIVEEILADRYAVLAGTSRMTLAKLLWKLGKRMDGVDPRWIARFMTWSVLWSRIIALAVSIDVTAYAEKNRHLRKRW